MNTLLYMLMTWPYVWKTQNPSVTHSRKSTNLKLKGVGPINYHLGCGYTRDEDGTLVADPRKYVEKILESYEKSFGGKPKKTKTPRVGGDHPESDISDFCDQ